MHKKLATFTVLAVLGVIGAGSAVAGQPDESVGLLRPGQGCEPSRVAGRRRPGASEWGALAADRAEENGDENRAWKDSCGGSPS